MRAAQRTEIPSPVDEPAPRSAHDQPRQGGQAQEAYKVTGIGPGSAQWRNSLICDLPALPVEFLEHQMAGFGIYRVNAMVRRSSFPLHGIQTEAGRDVELRPARAVVGKFQGDG